MMRTLTTPPPRPGMRRSSQCSHHWRHKRLRMQPALEKCLLLKHACRSYTARRSLPALRTPPCSTLGHLRCSSLTGQALERALAQVPVLVRALAGVPASVPEVGPATEPRERER